MEVTYHISSARILNYNTQQVCQEPGVMFDDTSHQPLNLKICALQHHENQDVPVKACLSAASPSSGLIKTGLLQFSTGRPSNQSSKDLANDSECSSTHQVFNQPKRTHATPLLISLHWLPVAPRIKFESLKLAFRTIMANDLP